MESSCVERGPMRAGSDACLRGMMHACQAPWTGHACGGWCMHRQCMMPVRVDKRRVCRAAVAVTATTGPSSGAGAAAAAAPADAAAAPSALPPADGAAAANGAAAGKLAAAANGAAAPKRQVVVSTVSSVSEVHSPSR